MQWRWPAIWSAERGGYWRVPLTLFFFATATVLGIFLNTGLMLAGLRQFIERQTPLFQDVLSLCGTVLIASLGLAGMFLGVRYVHHQPIGRLFSDGRPFDWRLAMQSALLWTVLWFAGTALLPGGYELLSQRAHSVSIIAWPVLVAATGGAMVIGRTAEEVVFRSYLQTRLAAWTRSPVLAVILSALLFTALHSGNVPAHAGIVFIAVALGASAIRTGTLAPAIGMHVAHDTLECLWHPAGPGGNSNASSTWWDVAFVAPALVVWFAWLFWSTRKPTTEGQIWQDRGARA